MANATTGKPVHDGSRSDADMVLAATRFLRMLRFRLRYVVVTIVVAALLGGLYFATAQRVYESRASLLVTQTGPDVWNTSLSAEGGNGLMPTCEKLIKSAVVLDEALRRIARLQEDLRVDFAPYPRDKWRERLRRNLTATAFRRTNLIELSYSSESPAGARAVVEAVVGSYLDFMDENHRNVSLEIVSVLERERKQIEHQLIEKRRQLLEVQHRVRDLGLADESNFVHPSVQRVLQLNETLVEVKKKRVQLQASLQALRRALEGGVNLRHHLIGVEPIVGRQLMLHALGLTPEASENLNQIERMLIEDRGRLDMLLAHYGRRHPDVMELERSIFHAQQYLVGNLANINERLAGAQDGQLGPMLVAQVDQQLTELREHENQLMQEIATSEDEAVRLNDRRAELRIVDDEMNRLRSFHKSLLDKITAIDVNQNRADVRLRVVSEPSQSDRPIAPRLSVVGFLCLLAGLGGGCAVAYVLDSLDDRFRSPEEMQEQLDLRLLSIVGNLPEAESTGVEGLQVCVAPQSPESEVFRTLRTALALSGEEHERIAFTSAEPGDGKTTLLANLGAVYAQAGKRTLLVDADLRRPGLTKLFQMRAMGGLSDVLQRKDDIERLCRERIQPSGIEHLDVLPCGPRPADPAELLSRSRMADVIGWAEQMYDQILIDCPPMLAANDAALVGRVVDGVVIVVQPQKNQRRAVIRAAESIQAWNVKVSGLVANLVGADKDAGYYGYSAESGYGYDYEPDSDEPGWERSEAQPGAPVVPRRAA